MRIVPVLFILLAMPLTLFAADWPAWRGPTGDGVSLEKGWTVWGDAGPRVLWKRKLGIGGHNKDGSSAVAIVGDRVFAMGTGNAFCLAADTGKVIWKIPFPASHSTPSVIDGDVYLYGTQGELRCVNAANGKTRWSSKLQRDHGASRAGAYGYAVSPVVIDNLVVVAARIGKGALVAFDRKTGKLKWRAKQAGHRGYAFWSTPVIATIESKRQLVWLPGPSLVGIDPATGKTLWKHEIPPENNKVGCAAATPVVFGNRIVAQYHPPHARGYTFCIEIRNGKPVVAWTDRTLANWYFSCVGYRGCLYGIDQSPRNRNRAQRDIGQFHCHDLKTGKLLWSINGFGQSGTRPVRYTRQWNPAGTFVIADGKLISWGKELVIAEVAATGHKVLAKAKLDHIGYRTMPVLSNGRLFLRARDGHLLCIDLRKQKEKKP